ncbi:DUF6461 domain-containing protein [Herbidospora cretacea]|uniref:DUF6461 domain-containing protein n=1 Tax=Herbidospora cretacea TaxID=28444 RepID=UPI0007738F6E|nr:DUF6461 domain-containing protein [Herbidospora cretacea]
MSTIFVEGTDDVDLGMLGFDAVWVHGTDIATLSSEFELDPTTREPCYLSQILDRHLDDGSRWVAQVGGWICVVPAPYEGDEFMRAVTTGGRKAVSLGMDVSNREYFKYAEDSRLITAFDPAFPSDAHGEDPRALDHLMAGLRFEINVEDDAQTWVETDEMLSSTLTLIGRITDTDMAADWFEARHSSMRDKRLASP